MLPAVLVLHQFLNRWPQKRGITHSDGADIDRSCRMKICWHQARELRKSRPNQTSVPHELEHDELREHTPSLPLSTFDRLVHERDREHDGDHTCRQPSEKGVATPELGLELVRHDASDEGE